MFPVFIFFFLGRGSCRGGISTLVAPVEIPAEEEDDKDLATE
jgi:hypothetical protein